MVDLRRTLALGAFCALGACGQQHLYATPPPGTMIDAFDQLSVAKTDILWVVDDSGSMAAEQAELASSFPKFFAHLQSAQLDYRLAVTTMDIFDTAGRLVGNPSVIVGGSQDPAVPSTSDPQGAFRQNILVGSSGSARDEGLEATSMALAQLEGGAATALDAGQPVLFLRPDAALFIVLVTDGIDYSPSEPRYYWRAFEQAKGIGNNALVTVSGILSEPPSGCGANPPGIRYYEVAEMSGGIVGSICDSSFDTALDQLGLQAIGLKRKFFLSQPADPTTLQVEVDYPCGTLDPSQTLLCQGPIASTCPAGIGAQCNANCDQKLLACAPPQSTQNGWTYEPSDNALIFAGGAIPGLGSVVKATYSVSGGSLP